MASHTPLNAAAEGVVARAGPTDSPHGTNEGIGTDHLLYLVRLHCIVEKCHMVLSVELASACITRVVSNPVWGSAFGPQNGYPELWSWFSSTLKYVPQSSTSLLPYVLFPVQYVLIFTPLGVIRHH